MDTGSFEFDVGQFPSTWWKISRLIRSKETSVLLYDGLYDLDFNRKFLYREVNSLMGRV